MMAPLSAPAQIVFTEDDRGGKWRGRLLRSSACLDVETGKPVAGAPRFDVEERADGSAWVTMQGSSSPSGRRHAVYPSVTAAQKAGIRWAGRRFRVPIHEVAGPEGSRLTARTVSVQ